VGINSNKEEIAVVVDIENEVIRLFKRQQIITACFLGSLLLLGFTVVYGLKSIKAIEFLIEKKEISPSDLLHTLRFWFGAIVASVCNYSLIFGAWYVSDKRFTRRLSQEK